MLVLLTISMSDHNQCGLTDHWHSLQLCVKITLMRCNRIQAVKQWKKLVWRRPSVLHCSTLLTVRTGVHLYCWLKLCSDRFDIWSVLRSSSERKTPSNTDKFRAVMKGNQCLLFHWYLIYAAVMVWFNGLAHVALNIMHSRPEVCCWHFHCKVDLSRACLQGCLTCMTWFFLTVP